MFAFRLIGASLAICAIAAAAEANPPSMPSFWRYAHPGAKMYMGVDLTRIFSSPAGKAIQKEMDRAGFKKVAADQGMGFFPSVDRVLISTTGESVAAAGKGNAAKKQPPVVIAVQGKFDTAALRKDMLEKGAARFAYKSAEIFRRGKTNDMLVALVSSQVMLLGDGPSLKLAIDHHDSADPGATATTLMNRAVELDGLYDLWFASEVSPSDVAEGAAGAAGPAQMFKDTEGFEGGISFKKGLGLDFAFHNKTGESASAMATALNLMAKLGQPDKDKDPEAAEMFDRLKIAANGSDVMVSLAFEEKDVLAAIDKIKSSAGPGSKRSTPTPVTLAKGAPAPQPASEPVVIAPAAKPAPLKIRILNLEEGPREIAFQ